MKNLKVRVITGLRSEQHFTIDADEAHKAYYLFNHPLERGTFNNGIAIRGQDIQQIVPDYQASMGWNDTHRLESDDWNEIRDKRVDYHLQRALSAASEVAQLCAPEDLKTPLLELVEKKFPQLLPPPVERREGKVTAISDIMKNKNGN